jgi:hypothetical protein
MISNQQLRCWYFIDLIQKVRGKGKPPTTSPNLPPEILSHWFQRLAGTSFYSWNQGTKASRTGVADRRRRPVITVGGGNRSAEGKGFDL